MYNSINVLYLFRCIIIFFLCFSFMFPLQPITYTQKKKLIRDFQFSHFLFIRKHARALHRERYNDSKHNYVQYLKMKIV
jgi:hypothetical protein